MKREILFRGKRTDGNGWAYGAYIPQSREIATFDAEAQDCTIPVNEDTVGQYTGLTDKHLKRIFEGDVLQYDDGEFLTELAVVVWDSYGFALEYHIHETTFLEYDICSEQFEIIGNIHDNPELLNSEGTARNGG